MCGPQSFRCTPIRGGWNFLVSTTAGPEPAQSSQPTTAAFSQTPRLLVHSMRGLARHPVYTLPGAIVSPGCHYPKQTAAPIFVGRARTGNHALFYFSLLQTTTS